MGIRQRTALGMIAIVVSVASVRAEFGGVTLKNVTQEKGLGGYIASAGDSHGPGGVFTDLDNDGYPDLVLVTGPDELTAVYRNVSAGASGERIFVEIEQDLLPVYCAESWPERSACPFGATGAIAGDYDNDGDLDLYVTNHPKNLSSAPPPDLPNFAPNVLWQNRFRETGTLTFVDATGSTDPTAPGCADEDLQCGLSHGWWDGNTLNEALTAAWSDVDRDGDLDLYVGHHNGTTSDVNGDPDFVPGIRDILYRNDGAAAGGEVTFTDITMAAGAEGFPFCFDEDPPQGHQQCYSSTNAVIFADLNNDAWPDLFVTNKTNNPEIDADMTYVNQGLDTSGDWLGFQNMTELTPAAAGAVFGRISPNAMGIDAGDFDNDGDLDLYITDLEIIFDPKAHLHPRDLQIQPAEIDARHSTEDGNPNRYTIDLDCKTCVSVPPNDLLTNRHLPSGALDFTVADAVAAQIEAQFSWGTQWLDINNDGWLDLHVATAYSEKAVDGFRDYLYLWDPIASQFIDRANALSIDPLDEEQRVDQRKNSRGDMAADYDRDGAVDLFVVNVEGNGIAAGPSVLWENLLDAGIAGHHFLNIKLLGDPTLTPAPYRSSRDAIGARAYVTADTGSGSMTQMREVVSGSSNATSTASLSLEFGLGFADSVTLFIKWPSGRTRLLHEVKANQFLVISEPPNEVFADGMESGDLSAWAQLP